MTNTTLDYSLWTFDSYNRGIDTGSDDQLQPMFGTDGLRALAA